MISIDEAGRPLLKETGQRYDRKASTCLIISQAPRGKLCHSQLFAATSRFFWAFEPSVPNLCIDDAWRNDFLFYFLMYDESKGYEGHEGHEGYEGYEEMVTVTCKTCQIRT